MIELCREDFSGQRADLTTERFHRAAFLMEFKVKLVKDLLWPLSSLHWEQALCEQRHFHNRLLPYPVSGKLQASSRQSYRLMTGTN